LIIAPDYVSATPPRLVITPAATISAIAAGHCSHYWPPLIIDAIDIDDYIDITLHDTHYELHLAIHYCRLRSHQPLYFIIILIIFIINYEP